MRSICLRCSGVAVLPLPVPADSASVAGDGSDRSCEGCGRRSGHSPLSAANVRPTAGRVLRRAAAEIRRTSFDRFRMGNEPLSSRPEPPCSVHNMWADRVKTLHCWAIPEAHTGAHAVALPSRRAPTCARRWNRDDGAPSDASCFCCCCLRSCASCCLRCALRCCLVTAAPLASACELAGTR